MENLRRVHMRETRLRPRVLAVSPNRDTAYPVCQKPENHLMENLRRVQMRETRLRPRVLAVSPNGDMAYPAYVKFNFFF